MAKFDSNYRPIINRAPTATHFTLLRMGGLSRATAHAFKRLMHRDVVSMFRGKLVQPMAHFRYGNQDRGSGVL